MQEATTTATTFTPGYTGWTTIITAPTGGWTLAWNDGLLGYAAPLGLGFNLGVGAAPMAEAAVVPVPATVPVEADALSQALKKIGKAAPKPKAPPAQLEPHELLWREMEDTVFARNRALETVTIEDVLRPLLRYSVPQLLQMPGNPQQVLCHQFLAYIKNVAPLREELITNKPCFNRLVEAICRCPAYVAKKEDKPSEKVS